MTDQALLRGDWMFVLPYPTPPTGEPAFSNYVDELVRGVTAAQIPVVLLECSLWDWRTDLTCPDPVTHQPVRLSSGVLSQDQVEYLVSKLRGISLGGGRYVTVAFHCCPTGKYKTSNARININRLSAWLYGDGTWVHDTQTPGSPGAVQKLARLREVLQTPTPPQETMIAYGDGSPWSDRFLYFDSLRGAVGPAGLLLEGDIDLDPNRTEANLHFRYIDGGTTTDQGDLGHSYYFAHPKQCADWRIQRLLAYRSFVPAWTRLEVGWIGECVEWWITPTRPPVSLWPAADYEYVWARAKSPDVNVAVQYRTTVERLQRLNGGVVDDQLQAIGQMETTGGSVAAVPKRWSGVAMAGDGAHLVAAAYGGRLYTSADAGATWTEWTPPASTSPDQNWSCVAISASVNPSSNDYTIIAGVWDGAVYVSADSGASWAKPVVAEQNQLWKHVAISADGAVMVARNTIFLNSDCDYYVSSDRGLTWSRNGTSDARVSWRHKTWSSVAMSSDGSLRLLSDSSTLWMVEPGSWDDYDFNFVWVNPDETTGPVLEHLPEDIDKSCVAVSSDGARLACAAWPGLLYTGTYVSGQMSWDFVSHQLPQGLNPQPYEEADPYDPYRNWQCMAMSSDGTKLIVGEWPGRLFYGTCANQVWTWQETGPKDGSAQFVNRHWESVAMSPGGQYIVATDGDAIYRSTDAGQTWTPVSPRVHNVTTGKSYPTIQAAINEATCGNESTPGDIIEISPGTYWELVKFHGKNITLRSTNPLDPGVVAATIIDGDHVSDSDGGHVVTFAGSERTVVLDGLTIANGAGCGVYGGAGSTCATATIRHCIIRDNAGYGISAIRDTDPNAVWPVNGIIENCTIQHNGQGGLNSCGTKVSNCTVVGNGYASGLGGFRLCAGSIENCLIAGNYCASVLGGGGIYADDQQVDIRNCTIIGNHAASDGGGICYYGSNPGVVKNCLIAGNSAGGNGGGIYGCPMGGITGCTITRNNAGQWGGGIYHTAGNPYTMWNSIVWGNTTDSNLARQLYLDFGSGNGLWVRYCDLPPASPTEVQVASGELRRPDTNVDLDPGFLNGCPFTSSQDASYSGITNQTTLHLNSSPSENLVNQLVNPDVGQSRLFVVASQDGTTLTVWGNASFVQANAAGAVVTGHLDPVASLCVDAGNPAGSYTDQTDIDGESRVIGGRVDIGADEAPHVEACNITRHINYNSVQAAIDAAEDDNDNVIEVAPRTHHERINFLGKNITVCGTDPTDPAVVAATIIDGDAGGTVVTFDGTETDAKLRGLTITNGLGPWYPPYQAGGIDGAPAGCKIDHCVVEGNEAGYGGGIAFCEAAIEDCTIRNNYACNGGGLGYCTGPILRCTIQGNGAFDYGIGYAGHGGGACECPQLRGCTILDNYAAYWGGGVSLSRVENCWIAGNYAGTGGGGVFATYGTVRNCTIVGNRVNYYYGGGGGGVCAENGIVQVLNCIVRDNINGPPGGQGAQLRSQVFALLRVSYSDVAGGQAQVAVDQAHYASLDWQAGNLDSDPLFVDADGADNNPATYGDNDYHLQGTPVVSPCINTGDPNHVPQPDEKDIDEEARVQDGRIEMGCDEVPGTMGGDGVSGTAMMPELVVGGAPPAATVGPTEAEQWAFEQALEQAGLLEQWRAFQAAQPEVGE